MQTQFTLMILAIGAFAVYTREVSAVQKKVIIPDVNRITDPEEIRKLMLGLQVEIDEISTKTYDGFKVAEEKVRNKKDNLLTSLTKQFRNMQNLSRIATKKFYLFFDRKENEGKIRDLCVINEKAQFKTKLEANLKKSTTCVEDVTQTALENIEYERQTFYEKGFSGRAKSDMMKKKWGACLEPAPDFECLKECICELKTRIKVTDKIGTQTLQKSKEAGTKGRTQADHCLDSYRKTLNKVWEKHAQIIAECIANFEDWR